MTDRDSLSLGGDVSTLKGGSSTNQAENLSLLERKAELQREKIVFLKLKLPREKVQVSKTQTWNSKVALLSLEGRKLF